jgi:hypothetical protein
MNRLFFDDDLGSLLQTTSWARWIKSTPFNRIYYPFSGLILFSSTLGLPSGLSTLHDFWSKFCARFLLLLCMLHAPIIPSSLISVILTMYGEYYKLRDSTLCYTNWSVLNYFTGDMKSHPWQIKLFRGGDVKAEWWLQYEINTAA